MLLTSNRWKHFTAMILIGDGMLAVVRPEHDTTAWACGPRPWRKLMRALHRRPALTRVLGAVQAAGAIYWALSQEEID
ncbi:MAG TPA: hypothetical protein VGR96_05030 [Acidobacteriaceae bacterium]|nr:hypothetical protein [Acidobacteriaceae bacterium]